MKNIVYEGIKIYQSRYLVNGQKRFYFFTEHVASRTLPLKKIKSLIDTAKKIIEAGRTLTNKGA